MIAVAPQWLYSQPPAAGAAASAESQPTAAAAPAYPPPATDADAAVAAARAKTFGLAGMPKISMRQTMWGGDVASMRNVPEQSIKALAAALGQPVDDATRGGTMAVTLAWQLSLGGGTKLLFQEDSARDEDAARPPALATQSYYWDGAEGWIGETSFRGRHIYRYADLEKVMENIRPVMHVYVPHWVAAGGRLSWPGPELVIRDYNVAPELTRYQHVGAGMIAGVDCEMYDGPARRERVWIEKATGLVKAVSESDVHGELPNYYTELVREVAGRTFADAKEYGAWREGQPPEMQARLSAFWSAAHWAVSEPDALVVFSDYREIAPGVHWPMRCEKIASLPAGRGGKGGYRFLRGETVVTDIAEEFSIEELASARPRADDAVTDRRAEPEVNYPWEEQMAESAVAAARAKTLAERRQTDEERQRINATPINSVDDAINVLTNGPNVEPTMVWARAIKYLVDHKDEGLPAVIKQLDAESRDHAISKLAFALRAMGDARAVPALIRALPRTLQPGRSDFGLELIEDAALLSFMQRNDQTGKERGAPRGTSITGVRFAR